ncbi:MAG TPA: Maf family protein [Xanthobacteraceae bacterium]|jgi:septum formation protein|nr:Maf family protein [Xanthobacteraceae bacterium]
MPLWLAAVPLVLASRSEVRRTLLEAAGIPVEICPADINERGVEAGAPLQAPVAIAALLAREKASVIAGRNRERLVLGADQTLSLDGRRFTKPTDRAAARAQLRALSGRTHELYSAIAFVQDGVVLFEHVGVARLTMRAVSDQFLDDYLDAAGDAATASVGAYQLEGFGIQLFERLDGDYFTVLGLPLLTALDFLRRHGCLAQ